MATIRVTGDVSDLAATLAAAPAKLKRLGHAAVRESVEDGAETAKKIARAAAGPHGTNYHKRIDSEMTGALRGEYGPSAPKTRFTGVSGSEGAMRDLVKSAGPTAARFQRRVGRVADRLLW